jgi:nicotinamidase-related amidase
MTDLGGAQQRARHRLLTPDDCVLALIDHQPQMAFAVSSIDNGALLNNVTALAKSAALFEVPTVLTTVSAESFSGPMFDEVREVFPGQTPIDRTTMNAWEDENFHRAVLDAARPCLVIAGLWTEVCVVFPALQALEEGLEVFVVADACGGTSQAAHELAMRRMEAAGAVPLTWLQLLLEWQRDWGRSGTAGRTGEICRRHAGMFGTGIKYYGAVAAHDR